MQDLDKTEGGQSGREEVFSKAVRAGKRTYFFDVKSTKNSEQYLTVTESKKVFDGEGKFHFEKHKIFLYREDFEKFLSGMQEAVDFIDGDKRSFDRQNEKEPDSEKGLEKENTVVRFDDL